MTITIDPTFLLTVVIGSLIGVAIGWLLVHVIGPGLLILGVFFLDLIGDFSERFRRK